MAGVSLVTLDSLIVEYGLDQSNLHKQCSEKIILDLAKLLKNCNWERVALHLDIEPIEVEVSSDRIVLWNRLLRLWLERNAYTATFSWLLTALLDAGCRNSATKVCELLKPPPGVLYYQVKLAIFFISKKFLHAIQHNSVHYGHHTLTTDYFFTGNNFPLFMLICMHQQLPVPLSFHRLII